ncbi:MAG: ribonuclease III [Methanoregulaceae archaeon PtaU1.Bin222]|nr:MAG: ribonuclease III [Methanoregulaceae archaeon PtaU1.Bin222]
MDDMSDWTGYRDRICYPAETFLLQFPVQDKERLISAIISNAFLNEKIPFEQLRTIHEDHSLATLGDFVLDYAIIANYPVNETVTPQKINDFRERYGNNTTLHRYARDCLNLQEYILWGPDQRAKKIWNQESTYLLADRFEMIIGALYLEKGLDGVLEFLARHRFFKKIDDL